MANVGGPKGSDPVKTGKVVPLHRLKTASAPASEPAENKTEISKPQQASEGAVFDPNASKEVVLPDASADLVRGAGVKARLTALGVRGSEGLPIKGRDVVRVKDTPIGKILEGSVTVQSAKGMERLEGVVRVTGDLTLQEARLAGGDVTPVIGLVEIGGRLTIEGVS